MRAYAAKTFELETVEDGETYRQILQGLIERTHKPDRKAEYEAELRCPPFPDALAYVWQAFLRLSARRQVGFSVNAISWCEIDAFIRNAGLRLAPWEIGLIEDLDNLYRQALNKKD